MGTWTNAFGKSVEEGKKSVELSVPGKTKKEQAQYTTSNLGIKRRSNVILVYMENFKKEIRVDLLSLSLSFVY